MSGLDRFVFTDVETTGLDFDEDAVLEVGFVITDSNLIVIDMLEVLIWDSPFYDRKIPERLEMTPFVKAMHEKNALLLSAQANGCAVDEARIQIESWLDGHGVSDEPICGSSVNFDKSFLERLINYRDFFSHRVIDSSTLKELCRRLNPELYAKIGDHTIKRERHRVIPDIEDSISELRFYIDNFLFVPAA